MPITLGKEILPSGGALSMTIQLEGANTAVGTAAMLNSSSSAATRLRLAGKPLRSSLRLW